MREHIYFDATQRHDIARLRAMRRCMSDMHVTLLHQGPDHVYDFADNLPESWPARDFIGSSEQTGLPDAISRPLREAIERVRRSGISESVDLHVESPQGRQIFEAKIALDLEDDTSEQGLCIMLCDVTEARHQDLALKNLIREVNHRSKNLLAIIQSIAAQTAVYAGGTEEFLRKFRGRLQALASTQDLVTASDWRGVPLHALLMAQLPHPGARAAETVAISGDNPLIDPNTALHIGLAIYELASNARAYGALSQPGLGHVAIETRLERSETGPPALSLEWNETALQTRTSEDRPRFGTIVLERVVPQSVGGQARLVRDAHGLHYWLSIPDHRFAS